MIIIVLGRQQAPIPPRKAFIRRKLKFCLDAK
jgi:hypothetical protein